MSNSQTIAKNSLFLYFRMLITMVVGLYTSRVVLAELGVVDYGIYGAVGGMVMLFGFLNSAMSSATTRYLTIDLAKNDTKRLNQTFSATLTIHFVIGLIILLLAETVGLWYINTNLNVPEDRMYAVNWVYQFSVFSFLFSLIQVPYTALMIAHEHMKVYAYISLLDSGLKLIVAFLIVGFGSDKLIFYSFLMLLVTTVVRFSYQFYCRYHFKESKFAFFYNKAYYKELISYSGWNLFGSISSVTRLQGSNLLLNFYFGPVVNAAYSLALLVQGIMGSFVNNFQMAVNPQIIKNYAIHEKRKMISLIYLSSKFTFFGALIISLPFLFNINYLLNVWLEEIPKYTVEFMQLIIINLLIDVISNPLIVSVQATGKIKYYQMLLSFIIILIIPISWVMFYFGYNPILLFKVMIVLTTLSLFVRLLFVKQLLNMDILEYLKSVLMPILAVSFLLMLSIYFLNRYLEFYETFDSFVISSLIIVALSVLLISIIGLNKKERKYFYNLFITKILKR